MSLTTHNSSGISSESSNSASDTNDFDDTPSVSGNNVSVNDTLGNVSALAAVYQVSDRQANADECETCRATFRTRALYERHRLFCGTLAEIRGHSGGAISSKPKPKSGAGAGATGGSNHKKYTVMSVEDDALLPSPKEMFMLIQELAMKYNKVKDELDVMKNWAKMVGRRLGGGGVGGVGGGGADLAGSTSVSASISTEFTSIARQKRQNMEMILNEEDADMSAAAAASGHECPVLLRPTFTQWYSSFVLTESHLEYVFQSDLVSGIVSILLKIVADHAATTTSNRNMSLPFKFSDVKQGSFYIYDSPFSLDASVLPTNAADRKWRFIEPCEFQQMVNTIHKLLFKEFKKWQDRNWEAQQQMTKQRQKATVSYQNVMSSFQCSPGMATCDGMYPPNPSPTSGGQGQGMGVGATTSDEPVTPPPAYLNDAALSEDFATLYNKYADKMMGGALSNEVIITKVRAKLWKDMKAWML